MRSQPSSCKPGKGSSVGTDLRLPSHQDCAKEMSVFQATQSMAFRYSSSSRLRQQVFKNTRDCFPDIRLWAKNIISGYNDDFKDREEMEHRSLSFQILLLSHVPLCLLQVLQGYHACLLTVPYMFLSTLVPLFFFLFLFSSSPIQSYKCIQFAVKPIQWFLNFKYCIFFILNVHLIFIDSNSCLFHIFYYSTNIFS